MIRFTDAVSIGQTKQTSEGYLVASSRVARTGVQKYLAREIGDAATIYGFKPNDVVTVYRHEDQVFAKDTLNSLSRVPVTLDHPKENVDSTNWRDFAVGEVGDDVLRDGEWIVVNPMIKDAAALRAAQTTHREISMGYTANIVKARDGVNADFEMVDIRMNHLALVPRGRAGSEARIGDSADNWGASPVTVEDDKMTVEYKAVVFGDKAVQVEAKDFDLVMAALKDHKTAIEAKDAEIAVKDAEIAKMKSEVLTDADVDAMIEAKAAKKKKREEVEAKIGDKAKDFTDEQIDVAHAMLDAMPDNKARKVLGDRKSVDVTDGRAAWDAIYDKKGK